MFWFIFTDPRSLRTRTFAHTLVFPESIFGEESALSSKQIISRGIPFGSQGADFVPRNIVV